jgi:hypothetical protein
MAQSSSAKADVETLHKAFKGIGTDEKAVIGVLGHRTKEQLRAIAAEYPQTHKHSLDENLRSELSGHFRDLAVGLATDPTKVRIQLLEKATKGAGTRERALIDILVGCTNDEIRQIQQEDPRIIAGVLNDVSGDFKKVLVELLKGTRETNTTVDDEQAQAVAEKLYKAGEGKLGTDEAVFVDIIAKKSPEFLAKVSDFYKAKHKHSLEQAVKSETSGYFEDTLVGLLKTRLVFIADRIFKAMDGAGTDDTCLVYFFSVLSKKEIQEVARIFQQRHQKSMAEVIKGDTSGDYRNLLLALLSGYL